jgi:hypothetical protein
MYLTLYVSTALVNHGDNGAMLVIDTNESLCLLIRYLSI